MRTLVRGLAWAAALGLVLLVAAGVVATHRGYRLEVVRSGSMVPAFAPGDAVVIAPVDGPVVPGEVVIFRHSTRSDDLVTHRVTDVTSAGVVHTKGDANATADVWDVSPDQVEGVQRWVVPRLGYAIVFLRDPHGLGAVLCLLVALFLIVHTLLAARRGEGPFDAVLGRHAGGSRSDGPPWVATGPPPGFGRLAGVQYPCLVVDGAGRWPGRVFAWQRRDDDWRALVRVTRTGDDGRSSTTEQWLAPSQLEPVVTR